MSETDKPRTTIKIQPMKVMPDGTLEEDGEPIELTAKWKTDYSELVNPATPVKPHTPNHLN